MSESNNYSVLPNPMPIKIVENNNYLTKSQLAGTGTTSTVRSLDFVIVNIRRKTQPKFLEMLHPPAPK